MKINCSFPEKIYRYSEKRYLQKALDFGEFMVFPASKYMAHENDVSRYDDELIKTRSVSSGKFSITVKRTGQVIKPIGDVVYQRNMGTNYYVVCFSEIWDEKLFEEFSNTNACLIVHDVAEFEERFHTAMEKILPDWVGWGGAVVYNGETALGTAFMKHKKYSSQHEWRLAWRPRTPKMELEPIRVCMGSIFDIAEIVDKK